MQNRKDTAVDGFEEIRVPIVGERLAEEAATRESRIRIRIKPEARQESVETEIAAILVELDRRPNGRLVKRAATPRWEGDVLVVPVVEEVRLSRRRTRRRVKETVTLRRTSVDVERSPKDSVPTASEDRPCRKP